MIKRCWYSRSWYKPGWYRFAGTVSSARSTDEASERNGRSRRPVGDLASGRVRGPVHGMALTMGAVFSIGALIGFSAAPSVAQSGTSSAAVQAAVTTPPTLPAADSTDGTTVAGAGTAGSVPSSVPVAAPRFSDPVADLASAALSSLKGRLSDPPALPAVTTAPATPTTAPIVGGNAVRSQVAVGTGDQTWSAVVLDTSSLSDYYLGTAVAAPSNPKTVAALSTLPTEGSARYEAALRQLATMVADRTKVDPTQLLNVWEHTDPARMRAVLTALAQVGTMYRYTGNQPGGFDCSGLTSYSWAQAGVKIPRTSTEQIAWAAPRTQDAIQPGDILWRPGHVGLYLGVGDAMVHSPQTGKPVEVRRWGKITRFGSPLS